MTANESNLNYAGEPGCLNESMSDVFTAVCESWESGTWSTAADIWKVGEDAWTPGTAGDALRYMDDPAFDGMSLDWYPDYTPDMDVHYCSGLSNLAFALLVKAGGRPTRLPPGDRELGEPGMAGGRGDLVRLLARLRRVHQRDDERHLLSLGRLATQYLRGPAHSLLSR